MSGVTYSRSRYPPLERLGEIAGQSLEEIFSVALKSHSASQPSPEAGKEQSRTSLARHQSHRNKSVVSETTTFPPPCLDPTQEAWP